ncbi:hypothetical protein SNEBB_004361 [Seison nebaliae]|nr:hypothetical protein SNEBB_004361 [Seison nebaliae]
MICSFDVYDAVLRRNNAENRKLYKKLLTEYYTLEKFEIIAIFWLTFDVDEAKNVNNVKISFDNENDCLTNVEIYEKRQDNLNNFISLSPQIKCTCQFREVDENDAFIVVAGEFVSVSKIELMIKKNLTDTIRFSYGAVRGTLLSDPDVDVIRFPYSQLVIDDCNVLIRKLRNLNLHLYCDDFIPTQYYSSQIIPVNTILNKDAFNVQIKNLMKNYFNKFHPIVSIRPLFHNDEYYLIRMSLKVANQFVLITDQDNFDSFTQQLKEKYNFSEYDRPIPSQFIYLPHSQMEISKLSYLQSLKQFLKQFCEFDTKIINQKPITIKGKIQTEIEYVEETSVRRENEIKLKETKKIFDGITDIVGEGFDVDIIQDQNSHIFVSLNDINVIPISIIPSTKHISFSEVLVQHRLQFIRITFGESSLNSTAIDQQMPSLEDALFDLWTSSNQQIFDEDISITLQSPIVIQFSSSNAILLIVKINSKFTHKFKRYNAAHLLEPDIDVDNFSLSFPDFWQFEILKDWTTISSLYQPSSIQHHARVLQTDRTFFAIRLIISAPEKKNVKLEL